MQLIERNAPLPYVQAQLGHASISMTVDVYGRWLPSGNRALIDQLDTDRTPAGAVAAAASGGVRNQGSGTENDDPAEASGSRLVADLSPENPEPAEIPTIPPPSTFYVLNDLFASA